MKKHYAKALAKNLVRKVEEKFVDCDWRFNLIEQIEILGQPNEHMSNDARVAHLCDIKVKYWLWD